MAPRRKKGTVVHIKQTPLLSKKRKKNRSQPAKAFFFGGGCIHPAKVGLPGLIIDKQGNDEDDSIRTRNGFCVVGCGPQPSGRDEDGKLLLKEVLPGEGFNTCIDQINRVLIDVNTHHFAACVSKLNCQWQTDLSKSNNCYAH